MTTQPSTITFKTKPDEDGVIRLPKELASRADGFRTHPRWGDYTNSNMFDKMLHRALEANGVDRYGRLVNDHPSVTITPQGSGFMVSVSIDCTNMWWK